jgi:uncharacterized repeat protein (TIGR03803 family)
MASIALSIFGMPAQALAQTEKVLHSFPASSGDGYDNYGGVVRDSSGNLYGATFGGGAYLGGTVYELSPLPGGGWGERILHSFNNNGSDGYQPYAGLTLDSAGNIYGTTRLGGAFGDGAVFELTLSGGAWTEKLLHNFGASGSDGLSPYSSVTLDASGNIYGTTILGGSYSSGTVFELNKVGAVWSERIVHSFDPNNGDGFNPYAPLIMDSAGNLYGVTYGCQCSYSNDGTVFELKRTAGGGWAEKILHAFLINGVDGVAPYGGLTFDSAGNLYGTTTGGGTGTNCGGGCGTVFKLSQLPGGSWDETILHNFEDSSADGGGPYGTLVFDSGNLYGTTVVGGPYNGGTLFELSPTAGGWNETTIHNFQGNSTDGSVPYAGVIFDPAGNIYGTTLEYGPHGGGMVFEIRP